MAVPTGPRPDPPTRCARLVYSGHFGGAPWVNVMWLYLTGSGVITTSNLNALADKCAYAYIDNLLPLLSDQGELQTTSVALFDGPDVFEGFSDRLVAGGHTAGDPLPANIACCVSWQIAPRYRGGHPRSYLAGLSTDQIASVVSWNSTFLAAAGSAVTAFHGQLEGITGVGSSIASVEHGVVSFVRAKAWREPPVFYRIAGGSVDVRIDSQRRRLGRDL